MFPAFVRDCLCHAVLLCLYCSQSTRVPPLAGSMPGDPVGWTSLIAYGVQEPFVSFPVLFVADLQNDRSAEPLDTLPAAGLGAAARAASPLIPH